MASSKYSSRDSANPRRRRRPEGITSNACTECKRKRTKVSDQASRLSLDKQTQADAIHLTVRRRTPLLLMRGSWLERLRVQPAGRNGQKGTCEQNRFPESSIQDGDSDIESNRHSWECRRYCAAIEKGRKPWSDCAADRIYIFARVWKQPRSYGGSIDSFRARDQTLCGPGRKQRAAYDR